MQQSDIPTRIQVPFADAGLRNTIPIAAPTTPGLASYTEGFPEPCFTPLEAGGIPPFGQDFNGLAYAITRWLQWTNAGGPVPYDADFSTVVGGYPRGAVVSSATVGGASWVSTVDDNTTDPATSSPTGPWAWAEPGTWSAVVWSAAGAANALAVNIVPAPATLIPGMRLTIRPSSTNTGTVTLAVNGGAPAQVLRQDGAALQAGDLVSGVMYDLRYDTSAALWRLMSLVQSQARIRLSVNATFYVSPAGSDATGTGSSASPWATPQHAWDVVQRYYDLAGFSVTVQLVAGTYAGGIIASGPLMGAAGYAAFTVRGDPSAPASYLISLLSGICFRASAGAQYSLSGVRMTAGGANPKLVSTDSGGVINIAATCDFGPALTGDQIQSQIGGTVWLQSNYTVSGSANTHYNAAQNGNIWLAGYTVTVTGNPTYSTAFCSASVSGQVSANSSTYTGAATGQRYVAASGGVINTASGGGNFFPGSVAGTTNTGGIYA